MFKMKSIRFPDLNVTSKPVQFAVLSRNSVLQTQKSFRETLSFAHAFCGFVSEKCKTQELSKQIAANKSALDTEIAEKEEQLRIAFEELDKRLKVEYDEKYHMLELELQKETETVETKLLETQKSYEAYLRTSRVHTQIFRLAHELCMDLSRQIEWVQKSESAEQLMQNRYYIQLCEQHRRLLAQVTELLKSLA